MIDASSLRAMFPAAGARLTPFLPHFKDALAFGEINTPARQAAFLAHLAHESGEFRWLEELATGADYEGRADLGNTDDGDGERYKGRGPIQITGHAAYMACGAFMGVDLLAKPELLLQPEYGMRSAAWFWRYYKPPLNRCADRGWFQVTTRLVNGGLNGWPARLAYYQRNRRLLGLEPYTEASEDSDIRAFQAAHGLVVDGTVGPRTLAALMRESRP